MPDQKWPDSLWLVRHGESSGNVARDDAEANGSAVIDIDERDMDVPLSDLGERQASALGSWLRREQAADRLPTAALVSPFVRAVDTARLVLSAAGLTDVPLVVDERLREREFGVLDRLTKLGITEQFPAEAEARARIGKFYHRPPGGESWADVIFRQRSVLDTLTRDYRGERVLIVSHQVVILMYRYLLERMTEQEILAVGSEHEVANCSLTAYEFDPGMGSRGKLSLQCFNTVVPLEDEGEQVTVERERSSAES